MEPMLSPLSIDEINNAAPVEIELPEEPDLTIVEISLEINPDEKFKQNRRRTSVYMGRSSCSR